MERSLDRLNAVMAEVMDLRHAASLMSWDEQVLMPRGAGAGRSLAAATVRKMAHEKFTSAEVGDLLAAERARLGRRDPSSEIGRLLAVTARDYEKATRVPATYVAEHAQVTSVARLVWQEARSRSDFTLFAPHLEKIIGLKRQYVSFFAPTAHPYDILLDDYEPGLTTHDVQVLFDALRSRQRDLIRRVAACPQIGDRLLHLAHPEQGLWDFGVDVATAFGFDWTRGRQDKSVHPFTGGSGPDDVRITTRFEPQQPLTAVFATMHETGHALYEQGVDPRWTRTALEGGASLGLHESQSRLWENLVGRSWPFWQHFWPKLQSLCHVTLHDVSLEEFYRTINRVQPSFIRVDADEATYNLHVMLRVEIEIAMLEETLSANDLPELWNAKMREYVGVEPPDARQGILQDMHWAIGLIGYFPTYTIGNVISAQLWETFLAVEPRRDELIQRGDFSALLAWLRRELHQHGRRFEPPDLLERITGRGIDPQPYLRYLEAKVGTVYQL